MSVFASKGPLAGLILVSGLCASVAVADPSLERLRACMSEQSDASRLVCYDKEMGRGAKGQPADLGLTPQLIVRSRPRPASRRRRRRHRLWPRK